MGLMPGEAAALRYGDIDLNAGTAMIRNVISQTETSTTTAESVPCSEPRSLPIPPHVQRYLNKHRSLYEDDDCFILTGKNAVPALHHIQNVLTSLCVKYSLADSLSATDLRNAFIRRCIQSGMDLYSLCEYIGIKQPNVIVKRFAGYFTPKLETVNLIEKFSSDYIQHPDTEFTGPKRMNLLILGAGSQGPVVKEIAEAIGVFNEIAFLDDDPHNKLAMGTLKDLPMLTERYPMAIPSFGDSYLRERYMNICEELGCVVPSLIHPTATVSPSAKVERSVVIEARCILSAGVTVDRGALISNASVVEVGAHIGKFTHIGSSVTVSKGAVVPDYVRVQAGSIILSESDIKKQTTYEHFTA
jgi:hypothetical protein